MWVSILVFFFFCTFAWSRRGEWKTPQARILSYLPIHSPSPTPIPGPWALVISTELERESDPSLIVRNMDFVWPQGKGWSGAARGLWLVRPGQGWGLGAGPRLTL